MQYVVVLDIDEAFLDGDDSIEAACRLVTTSFEHTFYYDDKTTPSVRPLSEVIAC